MIRRGAPVLVWLIVILAVIAGLYGLGIGGTTEIGQGIRAIGGGIVTAVQALAGGVSASPTGLAGNLPAAVAVAAVAGVLALLFLPIARTGAGRTVIVVAAVILGALLYSPGLVS